jgi:predicted helicase
MSQHLISRYLNELSDLRRVSGEARESVVREAFKTLLKDWGRSKDLIFIPEYKLDTATRDRRFVDGALLYEVRVPYGFWEAKDEEDDLDAEIQKKFRRGYPQDNIVFEDSRNAVLIQNRQEIMRCPVDDPDRLEKLLDLFFSHERPEVAEFRKAVAQFKADLPAVLAALRGMIERSEATNPQFRAAALHFLKHAQETINPSVTAGDVREMLIQHILTEEIFAHVFDNADFHRQNNVACELYRLEETFFTGAVKHRTLEGLKSYYAAIRSTAALVSSHHEKQNFLKVVYENFYKVYNPKAADRLGVIYTPNEIVRFMVEGTNWLCQRHFGRQLIDRNVEILDPTTGTGTFIAELIEHSRGQPPKLKYKYREELHANEVSILPYYVANLNIEATYAALTGDYEEYPNLCFVDTLDNIAGLRQRGKQGELFGAVSEENVARIRRQNQRKISVIIGNPPYNANQLNENENNKNREYPAIDKRIKETYIAASAAQKTKLYDPYVRFFRWASDRVDENGIVAFVSNSSFVHKPSLDGMRKTLAAEYSDIWIVDLKGDARTAGERRRREGGNVFGNQIRVGITISFLIRKRSSAGCRVHYQEVRDYARADEKAAFLAKPIWERDFDELRPDDTGNWIGIASADFKNFLPLANRATKSVKVAAQERAIFRLYSLGISTNRDEWLYDFDKRHLRNKLTYLINEYDQVPQKPRDFPTNIKWSETLKRRKNAGQTEAFSANLIRQAAYRPFDAVWLYQSPLFIDRPGLSDVLFPAGQSNIAIGSSDVGSRTDYCVLATDGLADLHFGAAVDAYQQVPRYRFNGSERIDNVTDWALEQFQARYRAGNGDRRPITKDAIFHYVYGVLHDPTYREKYALNLKREFPRIPFYADFWRAAHWGERLMTLHTGYETIQPWPLDRIDVADDKSRKAGLPPKPLLRAHKIAGNIMLDTETQLSGIPKTAWDYRLGNRSALEWILDQHRERKPKDPTIREHFNTYRFADHKDKVIDLLTRVTRVSVETMDIVTAMKGATNLR